MPFENVKIFNNTAFQSIIRQTGGSNLTIIDSIIYDNSISSTDAIIASADSNVYVKHSMEYFFDFIDCGWNIRVLKVVR